MRSNCSASGAAQLSLSAFLKGFKEKPNFIGEVSERRPWAIKREDRPADFAGRSKFRLGCLGYRGLSIRVSILSHPRSGFDIPSRHQSDQPTRSYCENAGGKYRDPLHEAPIIILEGMCFLDTVLMPMLFGQ